MDSFTGKVAVVTGAASGIGAAIAEALAMQGADVALADLHSPEATAERVRGHGVRAYPAKLDVADRNQVEDFADRTFSEFGRVNILCNNAGVVVFGGSTEVSEADWDWILNVNVKGVANGVAAFVPRMIETAANDGCIVNTASGAGLSASAALPLPAYTASKFAVVGLSEALRHEMAPHGIDVLILCPGSVKTNILESAHYTESVSHLRPSARGAPTPSREGIRRMEPPQVAELVIEGIRSREPYILTHPESRLTVEGRFANIVAAYDRAETRMS